MKESFTKLFSNIKLMTNTGPIIITIAFTAIMCIIVGQSGLILGPYLMYQVMFHDKNHRWDGQNWVDKDGIPHKKKNKESKEPVL